MQSGAIPRESCPMSEAHDELTDEPPIGEHTITNSNLKKRYTPHPVALQLLAIALFFLSQLTNYASATSIGHQSGPAGEQPSLERRKSIPHNVTHNLNQSTNAVSIVLIPVLVLASGLFAGLTIGYMSLDSTQLAVLANSGTPAQQLLAQKVAPLRAKGHMLLITLLIANMIANETLPIVTEKALGGGIQAIIISTVLVIVFSEIIPQTVCATYALRIGAFCAKPVQILIYLFYPIVWPISRLLTKLIGEHSGVIYRPSELKELVNLHARKSEHGGDLAEDVVTIIGSAIDLQERVVQDSMTALDHCFMLNIDTQLNYKTMSAILTSGHSRIPVYENVITPSGTGRKIVGALLTKQLILIDPEDGLLLREFPLNPLPHVASDMPLLNILNSFQEGRSHLAVVCPPANSLAHVELNEPKVEKKGNSGETSKRPWWSSIFKRKHGSSSPIISQGNSSEAFTLMSAVQPSKALLTDQPLGIISLEDVLEALLGEPIYDETDLDEHGHMAVPPYVPAEAAFALRKEPSLTSPSPDYDSKSSSYLSAGYENQAEIISSNGLSSKRAAPSHQVFDFERAQVKPRSIPSNLGMLDESQPTRTNNADGGTRIASLYAQAMSAPYSGGPGGSEVVDVHVPDREVDLHRGFTSSSRKSSLRHHQTRTVVSKDLHAASVNETSQTDREPTGTVPYLMSPTQDNSKFLGQPSDLRELNPDGSPDRMTSVFQAGPDRTGLHNDKSPTQQKR
ncbi:hypothetical protein PGT21_026854 [Puccinia graminis f. sp. tritici]|uniref:CNNM transmembrane domain-containing protein n=1 Tax=Puccinia graminis f. sp. tritici TaxID=56615 RepID=A0A5B0PEC2_PUCGR|nr:hypothetical protein PGTUg99_003891 [Puccinia graminis f. sp. tritici]KAA1099965.1 hypothetical protein PGT21_026854 [Puccinia graminis f. sp. tritici]